MLIILTVLAVLTVSVIPASQKKPGGRVRFPTEKMRILRWERNLRKDTSGWV